MVQMIFLISRNVQVIFRPSKCLEFQGKVYQNWKNHRYTRLPSFDQFEVV